MQYFVLPSGLHWQLTLVFCRCLMKPSFPLSFLGEGSILSSGVSHTAWGCTHAQCLNSGSAETWPDTNGRRHSSLVLLFTRGSSKTAHAPTSSRLSHCYIPWEWQSVHYNYTIPPGMTSQTHVYVFNILRLANVFSKGPDHISVSMPLILRVIYDYCFWIC